MAGIESHFEFVEDFIGAGTFSASATTDVWVVTDTSAAGTPTYTRLDHSETTGAYAPGVARLLMDSTAEAQNVCLSFGDKLALDFDRVQTVDMRIRLVSEGATKDSATTLAWGITGDRNDAIDSIAVAAIFRLASGSASNVVVVESDDTVNNNDDVATGQSLISAAGTGTWTRCVIDLSDKSDVKFHIANSSGSLVRVATGTTFDMSNYHGGIQPFVQIQKTSDTNTDAVEIDYIKITGIR